MDFDILWGTTGVKYVAVGFQEGSVVGKGAVLELAEHDLLLLNAPGHAAAVFMFEKLEGAR